MSEFWALVLGAALATLGGMLGTVFSGYLQSKNEIKKDRKEAYRKLMEICYIIYQSNQVDSQQRNVLLYEGMALASVYASQKVKIAFNNIAEFINNTSPDVQRGNKFLFELMNDLSLQIQEELNIPK